MEVTIDQALEIALNHYQQNELQQATEICQKVLEVATKNASAHHLLGLISLRRNNFGVARKLVHQALQLAPKDSDAHNSFGLILEKLGLLRSSALWFQKASFLNSNDASIVHNLANVLQSLGYQEAEQLSQHAMRINPNVANLRLQALGLDKTDISQDAFELQYQLALGNELADNGQHASAVSHYQRVLGKQETIFFFSPDIAVSPHFAAQCILGRTLQELGYQVVFLLCPELFYPFMVTDFSPDLSQLESLMQPEPTNLFREYYLGKAKLTLLNYGIAFVDLSSFIDHPVSTTVDGYMSRLPVDLREFEALNTKFGHLTCSDVILVIKDGSPEKRGAQVRQLWLKYIESAMFSFLAIEKVCRMLSVACLIHYNDYSPMLSARLAAKQSGVSVKLLTQASHKNVARSKIILLSAPWQVAEYESMDTNLWDKWKQLSLKSHQVEEGANDIIHRLTGRGSHVYSPAKRLEAVELTEQLGLNQQKKTLVAFTSSLDENFAAKSLLKGMGFHRAHPEQPFEDQIDWLSSLTRYVECSDALQLVVRIHPREGKNERESFSSRHLEILKDTFDRPFKSCRFVWPQDDISSYDLAEIADVALTSWSSMGAELARLGIPVLTSTNGIVFFPHEDFLEWGPTSEAYFQKLNFLLTESPSLNKTIKAFRWYNFYHLAPSIDLSDVYPSSDFMGLPDFVMPKKADTLKKVAIQNQDILSINLSKQKQYQSDLLPEQETYSVFYQLLRIISFILSGEDAGSASMEDYEKLDAHVKDHHLFISTGIKEIKEQTIIYENQGNLITRYSPMIARIAQLKVS